MPADRTDPRRFYGSVAVPKTYFGLAPENAISGYGAGLAGLPDYSITVKLDAGVTTPQLIGDLPLGIVINGVTSHKVLTTGTLRIFLPEQGEDDELELGDELDLTDAGPFTLTGLAYTPLVGRRPLYATITDGTSGEEALLTIKVSVLDNAWY